MWLAACGADDGGPAAEPTAAPGTSGGASSEAPGASSPAAPPEGIVAPGDLVADPVTVELTAARAANGGTLPSDDALGLFASIYGELPGVPAQFDGVRPGDGSLAIRNVLATWDELDAAQQRAISERLSEPGSGEPGGLRRAPTTPDAELQRAAESFAAEAAARFGAPLRARMVVMTAPQSTLGDDALADATPLSGGRFPPDAAHDTCRIRVREDRRDDRSTLAHEVVHCLQYDLAFASYLVTPDWIMEGSAEWAGTRLAGLGDVASGHFATWLRRDGSLFDLDYSAVGYFWTIESMGADPWRVIPPMLGLDGVAAIGASGLDPNEVALRIVTGPLRSSLAGFTDADPQWDLVPPDVPPMGVHEDVAVAPGRPIDRTGDMAPFNGTYPHVISVEGGTIDVAVKGSVGAFQLVGGALVTLVDAGSQRLCPVGPGPHIVLAAAGRIDLGPVQISVSSEAAACGDPTGRWVVDEPDDVADFAAGAVLELIAGETGATSLALTGGQAEPPTDCPFWGDVELTDAPDSATPRVTPPGGAEIVAAWSGGANYTCLDNRDQRIEVFVALLDDGRLWYTPALDPSLALTLVRAPE
jgi:hypothetical protein